VMRSERTWLRDSRARSGERVEQVEAVVRSGA
jgi:hypothetical protein